MNIYELQNRLVKKANFARLTGMMANKLKSNAGNMVNKLKTVDLNGLRDGALNKLNTVDLNGLRDGALNKMKEIQPIANNQLRSAKYNLQALGNKAKARMRADIEKRLEEHLAKRLADPIDEAEFIKALLRR